MSSFRAESSFTAVSPASRTSPDVSAKQILVEWLTKCRKGRVSRVKELIIVSFLLLGTFFENEIALNCESWVFEEDGEMGDQIFFLIFVKILIILY